MGISRYNHSLHSGGQLEPASENQVLHVRRIAKNMPQAFSEITKDMLEFDFDKMCKGQAHFIIKNIRLMQWMLKNHVEPWN